MDDDLALNPFALQRLAARWDDRAAELRGAADLMSRATVLGFSLELIGAAETFVAAWGERISASQRLGEDYAEAVRSVSSGLLRTDEAVGAALDVAGSRS